MRMPWRIAALSACLAVTACSHAPLPARPAVKVPANWQVVTTGGIENPQAWWRNFHDAQLDESVERALRANNDFAIAILRVRRSRLQEALIETNRAPSITAAASTGLTRSFDPAANFRTSGLASGIAYEVDLWGRLASLRNASHWEAAAALQDCRSFGAALVGTTAKLFWRLAYLNQLLAMADADIDYAVHTLELTHRKYDAGASSGLNTAEAELNLLNLQSNRTQLLQQRTETRNALAILFDQAPSTVAQERTTLPEDPMPMVAAGIPAQILANRPDLMAAELRLRATASQVDATRASFYPALSLTGGLGTASTGLLDILRNPFVALGAGLTFPFVELPTARLTTQLSESQYQESAVAFRQSLYAALAEVENLLSARAQLAADEALQSAAVGQARRAEAIARVRFEAGASDVQLWLDAQQRVRTVERSLLANRLNQFEVQADLYRALGLGIAVEQLNCGDS